MKRKDKKPARIAARIANDPRAVANRGKIGARVAEPVDWLYRHRQIDGRQRQAATIFSEAWHACEGSLPSSLSLGEVRATAASSPSERRLRAADRLANAVSLLGHYDSRLVTLVAVEGRSVREAATWLLGRPARKADSEYVGRRFREALSLLAEAWLGATAAAVMRGQAAPRSSESTQPGKTRRGRVIHATARKTYEI